MTNNSKPQDKVMASGRIVNKDDMRKHYKSIRAGMPEGDRAIKSRIVAELFLSSDIYQKAKVLMLYMPLGNETDTRDIIKTALADGKDVILPVTDGKSGIITPVYIDCKTVYVKGSLSISEPESGEMADVAEIDVFVVPGIVFDRKGGRIGFGKGCYDRLLKDAPGIKIGCCYDFQVCDEVCKDANDISMDYLLTEKGMIKC